MNHIFLVGRLVKTPELLLTESGKKISTVTLAVARPYKNQNGEYDTDFLDCTLWTGVADATAEYCKTGDVIGVKGRLQSRIVEREDGSKYKRVDVIAEKVTFLSSSRSNKDGENSDDVSDDGTCNVENIDIVNYENDVVDVNVVNEEVSTYSKKTRKSSKKKS